MTKKMLIDAAHPEEIRVALLDNNKVEDFDFESAARKPLRGNIYLARVTRVEPSLQAAFVEYGGNRHGFLAFSEIHPDYYQIPVSDRQLLQKAEAEVADLAAQLELVQRGDDEDDDDAGEDGEVETVASDEEETLTEAGAADEEEEEEDDDADGEDIVAEDADSSSEEEEEEEDVKKEDAKAQASGEDAASEDESTEVSAEETEEQEEAADESDQPYVELDEPEAKDNA
jgi:ribonuclease E